MPSWSNDIFRIMIQEFTKSAARSCCLCKHVIYQSRHILTFNRLCGILFISVRYTKCTIDSGNSLHFTPRHIWLSRRRMAERGSSLLSGHLLKLSQTKHMPHSKKTSLMFETTLHAWHGVYWCCWCKKKLRKPARCWYDDTTFHDRR